MKRGRFVFKAALTFLVFTLLLACFSGCFGEKDLLDPKNPVTVTVWNYYNGDQLAAFNQLVQQFNSTVGTERGIIVVDVSHGDINTLADSLIASVNADAGAQDVPMLAAVYSETAYILDKADALVDLDAYFTAEELEGYVDGFIEEGRFNENNELLLFPILKSTELFTANETDFAPFAQATGITLESIKTKEDLTAAAKAYYEWSDALTPDIAEDGRALYGRDSVANYIYLGFRQLGHEMYTFKNGELHVDLDKDTFRTLWDNYYVPFVNGYFGAYAKFRSEDCKTGKILALTSSSSSVSYLPTAVTLDDETTYDITTYQSKALPFAGAINDAVVQQGASYCLLKTTPEAQQGAVEFLKWFTEPQRNLSFAMMSGYSPVTVEANNEQAITASYTGDTSTLKGKNILNALIVSAKSFNENTTYSTKPFNGSKDVRVFIENTVRDVAVNDRAAVVSAIKGGATREQAVAEYVSDEYFDKFFEEFCFVINKLTEAE